MFLTLSHLPYLPQRETGEEAVSPNAPQRLTRGKPSILVDLGGQSGETVIENVSALSRVALGCVGGMPWDENVSGKFEPSAAM